MMMMIIMIVMMMMMTPGDSRTLTPRRRGTAQPRWVPHTQSLFTCNLSTFHISGPQIPTDVISV